MAIAEPATGAGAGTATCPLCHDYEGEPSSVEGHISSSTDPIHQGEVGRAHRDDLHRQVAETGDVESTDDPGTSATELGPSDDPSTDSGLPSEAPDTTGRGDQEGGDVPTDEELDRQRSQLVEDDDDQDGDDDHADDQLGDDCNADEFGDDSAGIPIPVSTGTLVVGLVGLFVLYWFVIRDRSSDDEQEQPAQQSPTQPPTGGLMG